MSTPSFSSFPPSFSSFPDLDPRPSKEISRSNSKGDRKEKHEEAFKDSTDSGSNGKKCKGRHRHRDSGVQLFDDERPPVKTDSKFPEIETAFHNPFFSDCKGDPLNIQYGGLHIGNVPKYRAVGRGRNILGLSSAWIATYRSGKGIEVGLGGRRKMPGLSDVSSRALLESAPKRRILQSTGDTHKYQEVDGYLPLSSRRDQKDHEQPYRSIAFSKDDDNFDSEASSSEPDSGSSTDDGSDEVTLTAHQETLKSLDQQLVGNPSSVDNWLLLLAHTLSKIPVTSKNATKTRSEITLSILSRAFAAHPRNGASKILRLKYMKSGEEVWHESKVRAEWEEALKVGGTEIWMEWLEWKIRKGNKGIDGVVEDVLRVLGVLAQDEDGEIAKVRVFWRLAIALQSAGFSERATALLQAQAELTFEVPQALYGLPHDALLDELEEFWESEMPRVGEKDSRGWAAWVSSGKRIHIPAPRSAPRSKDVMELDPYRQWAVEELRADRTSLIPTRSTDQSADEDPYSTVLFADIRKVLLNIQSLRAKKAFRMAWLAVLGLHIPGFSSSLCSADEINWNDRWDHGYLTSPAYLKALFPKDASQRRLSVEAVAGVIIGREKEYANAFGPVRCWAHGVFGLLDIRVGEEFGKGKERAGCWGKHDLEGLNVEFVRQLFMQLGLGTEDFEWDALTLAFEAVVDVKGALKCSRSFLSAAPNSMMHWAAHAQLERMRGRLDEARKVYQAVLFASIPQAGTTQLWWDWAEMEWLAGDGEQALNIILQSAGLEGRAGIVLLRCKRSLDGAIQEVRDEARWKWREAWIKLRALLELLTSNESAAALCVFDEHLSADRGRGVYHESLIVASLLMIYHYGVVLKNPIPPSMLRERAEEALAEYPSNSVILGLFLEAEKGQGIWGRVRRIMGESGGKAKDVARRVEEVWIAGWEKGRWADEVERTRSGLAAAVENERTRASAVVWRIYIEFEIRAGQPQRAKQLLFRAIGECPLTKELYLLAFESLRGVFNSQELDGLADTMAERGLRLRQGLDEVLKGWEFEDEEQNAGSGDSDDEIEHNAKELRRLMPY